MLRAFLKARRAPASAPPQVAGDERIYAIGDIHGRHDLLIRLLETILADARRFRDHRRTRLVFLGDYIDRGDESRKVLDALADLSRDGDGVVCLAGNHEIALLDFLDDPVGHGGWLGYGAEQFLYNYNVLFNISGATSDLRQRVAGALRVGLGDRIGFLRALPVLFRSGDVLFTHAAVRSGAGGTGFVADPWGDPAFLTAQPLAGLRVVHGHFDAPDPVLQPGRICVDTGAYYSGRLTAVRLDEGTAFLTSDGT